MCIKVVYNDRYGGFSLSPEAQDLLRRLGATDEMISYGTWLDNHRHDPRLVWVVESLGSERASGEHSQLRVHQLEGCLYRIREYDGLEWVEEPHHIRWLMVRT